jgi:glycosyltransferase involved in cell wall biosynthesis
VKYEPLVSVVIPTYNRDRHTIEAVESVLAQTYTNLEVIVVDDGSTDGSPQVIQQYIAQREYGSWQIQFVSQRNQGASVARNTGIAKARGEYIAFLDSDDIWLPEKLEWQMNAIEQFKGECGACVTDARLVNDSGMDISSSFRVHGRNYEETIGIDRDAVKLIADGFCGVWLSTLLARTDLIKQIGGFSTDISFVEDRDIHFRIALLTSIAYVNKPLIRTDRSPTPPGSTCRPWDKPEVQLRQQEHMLQKWLKIAIALSPDVRRILRRALGAMYSQQTNWYLENMRYAEARQAISNALRYKVTLGLIGKWTLTWVAPAVAKRVAPRTRPIGADGHSS